MTATKADWIAFLRPIALAVRNPPNDDDFRGRVVALMVAIPDAPPELLAKPWLQQEAMRKFQFWPAVFDIAELLAPELADMRKAALALPAPHQPWAPPVRTDAEVAAVHAKLAAFEQEAAAAKVAGSREGGLKGQPRYLNDREMEIALEAAIKGASSASAAGRLQFRLNALRQRMRVDA